VRLQEIAERLRTEFPGQDVAFDLGVWSFGKSTGRTEICCKIYTQESKSFECANLDDGIARLKAFQASRAEASPANIDVEPSTEPAPIASIHTDAVATTGCKVTTSTKQP